MSINMACMKLKVFSVRMLILYLFENRRIIYRRPTINYLYKE